MAQRVGGYWPTIRELIDLFTAMGCELHDLEGHIEGPDGKRRVRFLYNPENDGIASLSDYDDDDSVPPSVAENWERLLDITIPKHWP